MAHQDFFGTQLEVGDEVAFERPAYRELVVGTIIAFTPQKVRLTYYDSGSRSTREFLTLPNTVIKKPK